MPVSDDVVERAKRGDLASCEALLAASYPCVVRMARALTGDAGAANRVIDFVLTRGMRVLPSWRRGTTPENWFYHHTLLAARDAAASRPPPEPRADPLVAGAPAAAPADPGYVAFVRAVRSLPPQQREAFILHHGERLNPRMLGVAMDCSAGAADTHLGAATEALSAIAGPSLGLWSNALSRACLALGPAREAVGPAVGPYARGYVRPLRLKRLMRRVLLLALLLALAYAGWHWRQDLARWLKPALDRIHPSWIINARATARRDGASPAPAAARVYSPAL